MQLVLKDGNTVYDALLQSYGMDYAYKLLQENGIDSIDVEFYSGQILNFDENFQVPKVPDVSQTTIKVAGTVKNLTGKNGQSIYDLCQMTYGSFDLLLKLIQDSNIDSLNESDFYRKDVSYNENFIVDKIYYKDIIKAGTVLNTSESGVVRVLGNEDDTYFGTEDGFLILIE
jgi:hypothetical protein